MGEMNEPGSVDELFELYETTGDRSYGESITQIEHALQCAALARDEDASDALIVAALFHDVGHLAVDVARTSRTSPWTRRRRPRRARRAHPRAALWSARGPARITARDRQALALHARARLLRAALEASKLR